MISKKIRHLDEDQINEIIHTHYWQSIGRKTANSTPLKTKNLIEFKTTAGWNGIINISDWYKHFFGNQNLLNFSEWKQEELIALLCHCSLPFKITYPEYECKEINSAWAVHLTSVKLQSLLCFNTSECKIWLTKLPILNSELNNNRLPKSLIGRLPFQIGFSLGKSNVKRSLINRINIGDALIIECSEHDIFLGDKILGRYCIKDQHMTIENNDDLKQQDFDTQNAISSINEKLGTIPLNELPISLTFILQQSKVTLGELQDFFSGRVFPCKLDNYKKIIIQANGITLAQGELIWLEERPAILINSLENGHALK